MGGSLQATQSTDERGAQSAPGLGVSAFPKLLSAWHLLSLDAPTVAVVWTLLLARSSDVPLPRATAPAMFLAVWMLYVVDRLVDAGGSGEVLERRHLFHWKHRRLFLAGLSIAGVVFLALCARLPRAEIVAEAVLAIPVAGWFLLIHTPRSGKRRVLPKELAVGVIFAAAVSLPTYVQTVGHVQSLGLACLLFAVVCSINCLFIWRWERATGDSRQTHWITYSAARWVVPVTGALAGAGLATRTPFGVAIALSATGLLLLDRCRNKMNRTTLRAAADAVLLSPLLLVTWW